MPIPTGQTNRNPASTEVTMTDDNEPLQDGSTPVYGACSECGFAMFPLLSELPCGHAGPPTLMPFEGPGLVYSWTRVWLSEEPGRIIAMADFLDGRLRVTAPVVDADKIEIGDSVHLAPGIDTAYALRQKN